jgi:hypothetical protein
MKGEPVTGSRLRVLVLASRPSDYTEMSELARAMAARGHHPTLVYFYSPSDPGSQGIIRDMEALERASVSAQPVDIDSVNRGGDEVEDAGDVLSARERPSQATEEGLYNLVLLLRDRVLGREFAMQLRETLPTVRKIFPVIYKVARFVDIIRNLPDGIRMARRVWRHRLGQRLTQSRQMTLGMRIRVLVMGPKVVTDAAFMEQLYFRFLRFFRDLIRSVDAEALLIPEDIVGNLWPVAIKAAHQAGIPALVLPYTLANKQEAFQSLKDQPSYQTPANQIAAELYPAWRLVEGGADLVRLPSAHIFAHERLGITPPDPWMMNSGFADLICVDSSASLEYFRDGGIPPAQLRIVGSVSQDQMFERQRDRELHLKTMRQELRLGGEKPLLLLSGCPNQLAATVPYCEFTSIGEVANHVGNSLAPLTEHYHVVVRPHPNYPEFAELLTRFGISSTMARTASLVPLADLFVAFASATIRWAIACAVPTVNYDVFHYEYSDFAAAKGVLTVKGGDEFRDLVQTLRPGTPQLRSLAAAARNDSAHWSVMDGRGLNRIEEAIDHARKAR